MKPIIGILLSLSLIAFAADNPAPAFKDSSLEANVRKFIQGAEPGKPLTQDQLNHVYLVSASSQPIRDLAGLENCPNLNTIYLTGSQVSDLTPLSKLTNLEQLTISGRPGPGLETIGRSHAPAYLNLSLNQISDLTPLANLKDLQTLNLSSNAVAELGPLQGLTALQSLRLDGNQISDLKPLAGLKSLQMLSVKNNRVTDLTPLINLTAWRTLYLDQNQVSDLAPLVTMVAPDRQPIKGVTPFWIVSLRGNPLSAEARSRDLPELQKRAFDVIVDRELRDDYPARNRSTKSSGTLRLPPRPVPSRISGFTAPWKSEPPVTSNPCCLAS